MAITEFHYQVHSLLAELSGKILHVPNLNPLFPNWPRNVNKHLDRLRAKVDELIASVVQDEKRRKWLQKNDFGLFIAMWFADAEWEELLVGGMLHLWMFLWDDDIDSGDIDFSDTKIANNNAIAQIYCQQSIEYTRRAHGLKLADDDQASKGRAQLSIPVMSLFGQMCDGFRDGTDEVQRERIFRCLEAYMAQVGVEQAHRERGQIPGPEEFIQMRLLTSGVSAYVALNEFIVRAKFPNWIMESEDMEIITRETSICVMLINDIYSLKKELGGGSVLNLVSVLYFANGDRNLDRALQDTITVIRDSIQTLDKAFDGFKAMASSVNMEKEGEAFVNNCRLMVTSTMDFSLQSERYGISQHGLDDILKDNAISVAL